jgi:hypothetical protein
LLTGGGNVEKQSPWTFCQIQTEDNHESHRENAGIYPEKQDRPVIDARRKTG